MPQSKPVYSWVPRSRVSPLPTAVPACPSSACGVDVPMRQVWGAVELGFGSEPGGFVFCSSSSVNRFTGLQARGAGLLFLPRIRRVLRLVQCVQGLQLSAFPLLINVFVCSHPIRRELTKEYKTSCYLVDC